MQKTFLTIIISTFLLITGVFFIFKKDVKNDELVFWTLQMSDFAPYINEVITEFETQNPGVKIKWVDVPFSEGEKRTLASVLSDNPPDLVNLNPDFSATLAHKGALYEIPKDKTEQFNNEIIETLKYNGKYYSIPWYATSAITIYNKELLEKSKIALPKTYSDIFTNAKTVKNETGAFIFLPNITENDTMLKILNKYGISTLDNINSEKSVQVFNSFKNLYSQNLIPRETVSMTLQESLEKYMSGNIMMLTAGANFLNMIEENAPQTYKKTDVSAQITGDIGQYDFSLMNFVIPLRAKHHKEALEFALFLTNNENQIKLAKLTNILAVNKQTLKSDFYNIYDKNDPKAKSRVLSAKQLNRIQPAFKTQKNQKEINTIINSATQEILLNKSTTKNVLNKVYQEWKNIEE